jgi:hypothetical protein
MRSPFVCLETLSNFDGPRHVVSGATPDEAIAAQWIATTDIQR